jgi:hypothetical protein
MGGTAGYNGTATGEAPETTVQEQLQGKPAATCGHIYVNIITFPYI